MNGLKDLLSKNQRANVLNDVQVLVLHVFIA